MMPHKIASTRQKMAFLACLFIALFAGPFTSLGQSFSIGHGTGAPCVNSDNVFFIQGGSCTGVTWSATNGGVLSQQTNGSVHIYWPTATTAQVTATGSCGTITGYTFTVYATTSPVVTSFSATSATTICANGSVNFTMTASGVTSARYIYYVDGVSVYNNTSANFTLNNATLGLTAGTHSVTAQVSSQDPCPNPTAFTYATPITITINPLQTITAQLNAPANPVCSLNTSNVTFYATAGNMPSGASVTSYTWIINGSPQAPTANNFYTVATLSSGMTVACTIAATGCISNPSITTSTYTASITSATAPTVSIQVPKLNYCPGEVITLTASSANATGSSTYEWRINGTLFSTSNPATISASETAVGGTFYNGSTIGVVVNNLTGTCITTTTASNNTSTTPLNVYTRPTANTLPLSPTSVCSGTPLSLSIQNTNSISGTTFAWVVTGATNVSGYANGSGSTIGQTLTSTDGVTNGSLTYAITPTANGCAGPVYNAVVTVKPKPSVTNTAGQLNPAAICSGTAFNFTPTLSIAGAIYSWTSSTTGTIQPASVTSSGSSAITDTPINNGGSNGTVTYTITPSYNLCAGDPVTYNLTIKPTPNASASPPTTIVCDASNYSLTFSAGGVAGAVLSWTASFSNATGTASGTGTSLSATGNLVNHNAIGSVNYTVTAVANGCQGLSAFPTVTINPKPSSTATVTGNYRFGPGTFALNATGAAGGETYKWFNPSNALLATTATYTTPVESISTSNYCYVQVYNTYGCGGPSTWVNTTVYALPVITSTNNYMYLGIQPVMSTGVYDTYNWTNASAINVGTGSTLNVPSPGSYTVTVTKNGAVGTSATYLIQGQLDSQNANYIVSHDIQIDGVTTSAVVENLPIGNTIQNIQYFDGLGRPLQTVTTQGSPLQKDIVQNFAYDEFGREVIKHLPFVSTETNGWVKTGVVDISTGLPQGAALNFYNNLTDAIADDANPYAKTIFEPSPLNRPVEVGAPGAAWQPGSNHTIRKSYLTNAASDSVLMFVYDPVSATANVNPASTYYPVNQLMADKTLDEQGNDVIQFTDKEGRVICKKVRASSVAYAYTYYVYDDMGNLVFVFPPEAVRIIRSQF